MTDSQKTFSKDLIELFSQAVEKKIYGSIEIYFEEGIVTQITQRVINKLKKQNHKN